MKKYTQDELDKVIKIDPLSKEKYIENVSFTDCDFYNLNFFKIKFDNCHFKNVRFIKCQMVCMDFGYSKFDNVIFYKVNLNSTWFFYNVGIENCKFLSCDLSAVNFNKESG